MIKVWVRNTRMHEATLISTDLALKKIKVKVIGEQHDVGKKNRMNRNNLNQNTQ